MEKCHNAEFQTKAGAKDMRSSKKRRNSTTKKRRDKMIQPLLPKTASDVSSNWKALSSMLAKNTKPQKEKRKRPENNFSKQKKRKANLNQLAQDHHAKNVKTESNEIWFDDVDPEDIEKATGIKSDCLIDVEKNPTQSSLKPNPNQNIDDQDNVAGLIPRSTKCVGMDCEFVGIGKGGAEHMLARVSIVNSFGDILYDQFVAPQERIVDYRTDISGVRPSDLKKAPDFTEVQKDVAAIIKNKTLVGHSIATDLKVLFLDHPRKHIRDTAKYKPFQQRMRTKHPSLKKLAKEILSLSIQTGEHSSVEDARAAMQLYREYRREWEKSLKEKFTKTKSKPEKRDL